MGQPVWIQDQTFPIACRSSLTCCSRIVTGGMSGEKHLKFLRPTRPDEEFLTRRRATNSFILIARYGFVPRYKGHDGLRYFCATTEKYFEKNVVKKKRKAVRRAAFLNNDGVLAPITWHVAVFELYAAAKVVADPRVRRCRISRRGGRARTPDDRAWTALC